MLNTILYRSHEIIKLSPSINLRDQNRSENPTKINCIFLTVKSNEKQKKIDLNSSDDQLYTKNNNDKH